MRLLIWALPTAAFLASSITLVVTEPGAPVCAEMAPASVTVKRGGYLYNRATKRYR